MGRTEEQKRKRRESGEAQRYYAKKGKEYFHEFKVNRRKRIQAFIRDTKRDKPCVDCGHIFPVVCMDYHHENGDTKLYSVSQMLDQSEETISAEIEKCILLCANCHRVRGLT
jgi:hypothetical protein